MQEFIKPTPSVSSIIFFGLLAIAGTFAAVFVGLSISIGMWPIGLMVASAIPATITWLLLSKSKQENMDFVFWALLAWVIISNITLSAFNIKTAAAIEVFIIAYIPLALYFAKKPLARTPITSITTALLLTYFALATISSLQGGTGIATYAFQVFTNVKFFLLIIIGASLSWTSRSQHYLIKLTHYLWLPLLLVALIQLIVPSAYQSAFPYGVHTAWNDLTGTQKISSIFRHASYLGLYGAIFLAIAIIKWKQTKKIKYLCLSSAYLGLVVLSGERHELVNAIIITIVILFFPIKGAHNPWGRLLIAAFAIMAIALLTTHIAGEYIERQAMKMGIIGNDAPNQPRSVLYFDSFDIANKEFPIGSGLGTFGSASSAKFDHTLYQERGFQAFGWYGTNVLSDTYWPQYIAETGWFGFIIYASIFVTLILHAINSVKKANNDVDQFIWLIALASLLHIVSLSLASPAIEDPGLALIPAIFYGIALRRQSLIPLVQSTNKQVVQ